MARGDTSGKVLTVLGPVEPEELGVTLTHEHLLIDCTCRVTEAPEASNRAFRDAPVTMESLHHLPELIAYSIDNMRLLDESVAIEEVLRYKYAGGQSLVDTTSISIARDPLALARISRATGLNVVMGGSYYIPASHPPDMHERTEDSIAEQIVGDVTVGVGDTGVRSGVIGEVGNEGTPTENQFKILRASARAHVETGAPITIHPFSHPGGRMEIVETLVGAGADPTQIIMGHSDSFNEPGELRALAQTGCYIEIDIFGWEDSSRAQRTKGSNFVNDEQRIDSVELLVGEGHLEQVLISQDVCMKWMYVRYGGHGFAHLMENIVPRMKRRGLTDEQVRTIMVDNPARALTFK